MTTSRCPACGGALTLRTFAQRGESGSATWQGSCLVCAPCGGVGVNLAVIRRYVEGSAVGRLWRESRPGGRNCPSCRKPMAVAYPHRDLEIEVCRGCFSVWFDRGELARTLPLLPAVSVPDQIRSPMAAKGHPAVMPTSVSESVLSTIGDVVDLISLISWFF